MKEKFINIIKNLEQLLLFAIVFSALVITFVGIRIYMSLNEVNEQLANNKMLAGYISDIRYFDEVLTSSARLAANTGDPKWGDRYRFFEPRLDSAIKKAINLEPSGEAQNKLSMVDSANHMLVVLEHLALDLVAAGEQQKARGLLSGQKYEQEKALYSNGLTKFINIINQKNYERDTIIAKRTTYNYIIFLAATLLLMGIWILLMRIHISSRKELIRNNLLLEKEIQSSSQAEIIIQQQNEQLRELNATKDKLFSIIGHDLRSPFLGFLNLTQTIAEDAGKMSVQELIQYGTLMHQSVANLFNLLQNLLEWAQMQRGSISLSPKDILLTKILAEHAEAQKVISEPKRISIINMVKDSVYVYADEKMLNSILLNLLSNAIKFTHRNGTVTINAGKTKNKMIEVSIRDTGIGMPKNIEEKLFILGEETNRTGTNGELSTGLGLLLCKEFVEKNGGKIWVNTEEGKGSTFYFTLPSGSQ